jgi:Amt family ammonium transporter
MCRYAFNAGSTGTLADGNDVLAGVVCITTTMAGAAGGLFAFVESYFELGFFDPYRIVNGILAGLVGVTAGCAFVSYWEAIIIGTISALVTTLFANLLERLGIDDPLGAAPVHLGSGATGVICVGLFASPPTAVTNFQWVRGLFHGGGFHMLGVQALFFASVLIWTCSLAFLTFKLLDVTMGVRATVEHEQVGLDVVEHNIQRVVELDLGYTMVESETPTPMQRLIRFLRREKTDDKTAGAPNLGSFSFSVLSLTPFLFA